MRVRPLRLEDWEPVRALALETAERGAALKDAYPDERAIADALLRYYLEFEPQSSWVAELEGRVVGYLTGCLDTRRYLRVMRTRVVPACVLGALRRGTVFQRGAAGFLLGALRAAGPVYHERYLAEYPAHLHVNVGAAGRGRGVGRALVERFLEQARAAGVPGVHLAARADNAGGRAFFEKLGFALAETRSVRLPSGKRWIWRELCVYALKLALLLGPCAARAAPLVFDARDRLLVLAPHPDDEVLGCAGVIAEAVRRRLPLRIVFLTNGDDNEAAFLRYRRHPVLEPKAARAMGEVRRAEALAAARALGVSAADLVFLGYPDRGMTAIWTSHWADEPPYRSGLTRSSSVDYPEARRPGTPYLGQEVLADIAGVIRDFEPTKVFFSHPADHHPDHRALYAFATVALWQTASKALTYPYLIHFHGWPRPLGLHEEAALPPPQALADAATWIELPLSPGVRSLKQAALSKHRSQMSYSASALLAFVRANELFGDLPPVPLAQDETPLTTPAERAHAREPEEALADAERVRFVGIEEKRVRLEGGVLWFSLRFSRALPEGARVSLYAFGYRPERNFAKMPKIHVSVTGRGQRVQDQSQTLDSSAVTVVRDRREMRIGIPAALLGDPTRVLASSETRWLGLRLDWVAWRILELPESRS